MQYTPEQVQQAFEMAYPFAERAAKAEVERNANGDFIQTLLRILEQLLPLILKLLTPTA